jgi:hypothetical protein
MIIWNGLNSISISVHLIWEQRKRSPCTENSGKQIGRELYTDRQIDRFLISVGRLLKVLHRSAQTAP